MGELVKFRPRPKSGVEQLVEATNQAHDLRIAAEIAHNKTVDPTTYEPACSYCGAESWRTCRTESGYLRGPHQARRDAATVVGEPVFYHGTRRPFSRNGYVMPGTFHGGEGTFAPLVEGRESPAGADGFVFVTTSVELAWAYAWAAPGRGKPKVLTVQPLGVVEPDPEHAADMQAYRVDGMARVLCVDKVPLMDELEAMSGWAPF